MKTNRFKVAVKVKPYDIGGPPVGDMTLRDWFAGCALTGLVNTPDGQAGEDIVATAYVLAEQMLDERSRWLA